MNQIWKEQIINCPIHGKSITRTPVYQPNTSINTNYYIQRRPNNYSYNTFETEPTHEKSNSNYYYKSITSRRPHPRIEIKSTNNSKYSTINNTYNNNSVSLSNAYKSTSNNPVRIYGNTSSNYSLRNNVNTQRNNPINIKNRSNQIKVHSEVIVKKSYNINSNSQRNRINSSNNNINNNHSKGGTSSYRRRNENNQNNSMNIIQKKMTPDRIYNRTRNYNYSNDNNILSERSFGYNNTNLGNSGVYSVSSIENSYSIRTNNNRIREYSSKTNDLINRRIINTEPRQFSKKNNNSTIVNSTDSNNYRFYISGGNYLNYNNNIYDSQIAQPTLPYKKVYIQPNPYQRNINTEYYSGNNYNDNSLYEINKYMNKNPHSIYEVHYGFNNSNNIIKYDRSSPLLKPYDEIEENINTVPSIPRRPYVINIKKNKEINNEQSNTNKKKKKVMKYKIHQLKELRENQFKIENVKKEKIKEKNEISDDDKVEEHVEKYFDKDGNCIGGKKVIIKQEYDNGQKIIKKLVEEKYKSNSGYETLKKQGEINYNRGSKIPSSKKGSNIETFEENQEEENNNLNTIVTFGMNSKNSKIEDDIIFENTNEDKEADEQNIDINTEFDDEEKNDIINKEPNLDKNNSNEESEDEQDKNNCEEENLVNENLEEKSRENGGMNNDMEKNFVIEVDEKNNENQNEDFTNEKNKSIQNDM